MTSTADTEEKGRDTAARLPHAGRAALRAGVVGNFIDNVHVFLPAFALVPALASVAGPSAASSSGALVVIAMLLGRPIGGVVFGQLSDRLGRTRTTSIAISGTALCALAIAVMPTYVAIGAATIILILALRFAGGIFVAGEYSAAIPLAMEWSAPRRRGLFSGLILSMAPWAQGVISFATAALLVWLGAHRYATWGWRVLFLCGALASLGMLIYYRSRVADAPIFHRSAGQPHARTSVREMLTGSHRRAFWQVFTLMSGLWLLTNMTVLVLPGRLTADVGLTASDSALATGTASVAQALFMALAGHLSTRWGRRRVLVGWGFSSAVLGPVVWWGLVHSTGLAAAAGLAALLQVVTVAAYGPISAYLSERFVTAVRSTGYGMGYSLSLIIPALYPFYLPVLQRSLGRQTSVMALIVLGGTLLIVGAALGPALTPREIDADLDDVARAVTA